MYDEGVAKPASKAIIDFLSAGCDIRAGRPFFGNGTTLVIRASSFAQKLELF
jgi:hypothetical protein